MRKLLFFLFPLVSFSIAAQTPELPLTPGMKITQSATIKKDGYVLPADDRADFLEKTDWNKLRPVIRIVGENITVDFNFAELRGSEKNDRPDLYTGLAVLVKGKNITLKNARIRGYKVAVIAENVENLRLENCDFSWNYRPRLHSGRLREDFSDWLSYHHNEKDEWLRYGAGIYLKNCLRPTVKGCHITGGQNALLMTGCREGTIYNNIFQFNSGIGVGLYRSGGNKIMHNHLDWNVRGYSHGFYQRGQDSAAILVYEQSNENLFAYNSATHSGDGFFLWAGQSTMDTGKGGCNDNVIYGNDFSHAPTNGVEITFSRNTVQGNLIRECTYGIWGGYSYESTIMGNLLADCKTGIAIEHGQKNVIQQNLFQDDSVGVYCWARKSQPADWGYAKQRDVRSRDTRLDRNVFLGVRNPLKIGSSQNMVVNGQNLFVDFQKLLSVTSPNDGFKFLRNDLFAAPEVIERTWADSNLRDYKTLNFSKNGFPENPFEPLDIPLAELKEPDSLPDGIVAELPRDFPRGRQFILMGEWGPYDFRRPVAALDTTDGSSFSIVLIGPAGDWKIKGVEGVDYLSADKGTVPGLIQIRKNPLKSGFRLDFEYSGPSPITTALGETVPAQTAYAFSFDFYEPKMDWTTRFYRYDDATDPVKIADAFEQLRRQTPLAQRKQDYLWYAWWDKPVEEAPEDRFATISTAEAEFDPGYYIFSLTSDDGARLYLDGKRLIDHWTLHEPENDRVRVKLGGKHHIEIEHFDAAGFGALDFKVLREEN